MTRARHILIWSLIAISSLAGRLHADEVTLRDSTGRILPATPNVTILRIEGDQLLYRLPSGQERKQPLDRVVVLRPGGDVAFSAAEDAYIGKQWDVAIDGYLKSLSARDAWKIRYLAPRLMDAAGKAKRFDAALAAYIALAKTEPGVATTLKPALPAKGSKFLEDAVKDLDAAVRAAEGAGTKQALLSLLLDVNLARGDQPGAEAAVEQLLKIVGPDGSADPKLAAMLGDIRLGQARLAIEKKAYADAMKAIGAAGPQLTDPKQQAEALFIDAQARAGLAESAAPADRMNARLDAALAFMRVVAHFNDVEGKPFVGESMLRAGECLEAADRAADARLLYDQLAAEQPDTPFAAEAAKRSARLTGSR